MVLKASASEEAHQGFDSGLRQDFLGWSITNDLKCALQWLPGQAPGVMEVSAETGRPGVSKL